MEKEYNDNEVVTNSGMTRGELNEAINELNEEAAIRYNRHTVPDEVKALLEDDIMAVYKGTTNEGLEVYGIKRRGINSTVAGIYGPPVALTYDTKTKQAQLHEGFDKPFEIFRILEEQRREIRRRKREQNKKKCKLFRLQNNGYNSDFVLPTKIQAISTCTNQELSLIL